MAALRPAPITSAPVPARAVVEVVGLRASYRTRHFGVERDVQAVDDITLAVRPGEIYGLAGESSSGKTTLIKCIAGAIRPPLTILAGEVRFFHDGEMVDMAHASPEALEAVRWRHLSYIMQGSMSVLNPVRRIRWSFVDFAERHLRQPRAMFLDMVRAHLAQLHLDPAVLDAYPHELSGGMRQRVAIALATICRPGFIIADEPTTALDVVVQKSVLNLIREVQQKLGSSLLFVTHDLAVHAHLTDRLGIMYAGRLVEEGPTAEMFAEPKHPYTRHLIASLPRIGDTSQRKALPGSPPNLAKPPSGCRFHPRCPLAMARCTEQSPPLSKIAPNRRVACHAVSPEKSQ